MDPEQRQVTIQRLRELLAMVKARDVSGMDASDIGMFGEEMHAQIATIYPPETDHFKMLSAPLRGLELNRDSTVAITIVRDSLIGVIEWEMERLQPGSSGPPGFDPNLLRPDIRGPLSGTAGGMFTLSGSTAVLPPNWAEERAEMLLQLKAVDATLSEIKPLVETLGTVDGLREGIGGNNPPNPIEDTPIDAEYLNVTLAADSALRIQLSAEQPSSWEAVRLTALVLKRARRGLAALAEYLLHKGDTFLDSAVRAAGVAAVGMLATAVAIHNSLNQLTATLGDLVARLEHVLGAINPPL